MQNKFSSIRKSDECHIRQVWCDTTERIFKDNFVLQYAIFEPGTRNTGTAIAGKNIANPIAMLNAAVDMLEHLGHLTHAKLLSHAIDHTVNVDKIHTPGKL